MVKHLLPWIQNLQLTLKGPYIYLGRDILQDLTTHSLIFKIEFYPLVIKNNVFNREPHNQKK